jgi:hypothetical protein
MWEIMRMVRSDSKMMYSCKWEINVNGNGGNNEGKIMMVTFFFLVKIETQNFYDSI